MAHIGGLRPKRAEARVARVMAGIVAVAGVAVLWEILELETVLPHPVVIGAFSLWLAFVAYCSTLAGWI